MFMATDETDFADAKKRHLYIGKRQHPAALPQPNLC
jgi:hypothetical protein